MKVAEFLKVEADRYTKACQNSYLNPHPVPPRTIAASRIAPAMDPIMILVPLGPAQRKEGGRVRRRKRRSRNKTTPLKKHTSEDRSTVRQQRHLRRRKRRKGRVPEDRERWRKRGIHQQVGWRREEGAGEPGRSGRHQTKTKGERVSLITLFSHSCSQLEKRPAQGGFVAL